ncbi:hypothetical protein C8R44DRAFT_845821 [Mycena epipterygia]|nr:hypothetical protein C8R44DRAFT_845821 [Mycena epipterygia]
MQFSLVALAVLTTGVSAVPLDPLFNRAGTCNFNTCVAALAPSFPTACTPAVAQAGANTQLNTACLAAAAKGTAAFPTACAPCTSQFGVTDPANKAQGNANGATANGANPAAGAPAAVGPRANTCNVNTCVAALAPSFPTACDPAVAQAGANTPFNTACLAAAAKGTAAFPTACTPCAAQFGVTDPANNAKTNGATGNDAQGAPATPAATQNKAAGAGAPAAVGPRATCVVALEPSFPLCAPAIAQLGAETSFNAACLASAAQGTAAFPSSCSGCAAQFGVTDPGANTVPQAAPTTAPTATPVTAPAGIAIN